MQPRAKDPGQVEHDHQANGEDDREHDEPTRDPPGGGRLRMRPLGRGFVSSGERGQVSHCDQARRVEATAETPQRVIMGVIIELTSVPSWGDARPP
jgi:hypothetical protein